MRLLLAALLVAGAPLPAQAHLVTTGAGPFYDGAAHFFLSFEELLPVLALALLAGLRGARYGRWLIAVLPPAWLLGAALPTGFAFLSPLDGDGGTGGAGCPRRLGPRASPVERKRRGSRCSASWQGR